MTSLGLAATGIALVLMGLMFTSLLYPHSQAVVQVPMTDAAHRLQAATPSPTSAAPTSAAPTSAAPTSAAPTSAAPTSAAPTSASPTSASHTTDYQLWLPPTPNTTVVGSYGDYEWVYPATLDRAEFAQKRFTSSELQRCTPGQLCCAIGSKAGAGHVVIDGRGLDMNFMMEFQPIPHRPLFSLVDAILAWRRANPGAASNANINGSPLRMKLVVVGDSIGGQIYTAALCELARNAAVEWMTYSSLPHPPLHGAHQPSFQESYVKLKGGDDVYELLYIRQFKWTPNQKALQRFFRGADVIMFGLGLHYAVDINPPELIPAVLENIVSALRATHEPPHVRNRTLIWLGDVKQHFRYSKTDTQVTGLYNPKIRGGARFCGPVARFPLDHPKAQSISSRVFGYFTNAANDNYSTLSLPSTWFKWNAKPRELRPPATRGGGMHMHFYPLHELTSTLFESKTNSNVDPNVVSSDCSHVLAAPNLYESLWDALYLIVDAIMVEETSKPNNAVARFPAGTQQYPNFVSLNGSWEYQDIVRDLTGEEV